MEYTTYMKIDSESSACRNLKAVGSRHLEPGPSIHTSRFAVFDIMPCLFFLNTYVSGALNGALITLTIKSPFRIQIVPRWRSPFFREL